MKTFNQKDKRAPKDRDEKILIKAKYQITQGLSELGADAVEAYETYSRPLHICSFFKRQAGLAF